MKKLLLMTTLLFLATSCTSTKSVRQALKEDPSILLEAIKAQPLEFMDAIKQADQDSRKLRSERDSKLEAAALEQQFNNPLKPVIEESRAFSGPKDAAITIVEYSDFQCPFCSRGHKTIEEVKEMYPGQIKVVFKHLPLDFHPQAPLAASYFEAIAQQSSEKAFQFQNQLFENQEEIKLGETTLLKYAKAVGADMKKLKASLSGESLEKIKAQIKSDSAEARLFGVTGTPGFIVNGVAIRGAYPAAHFKMIIDRHLQTKK